MKVLICHRPGGAFGYISDGWINAIRDAGFKAERWNNKASKWKEFNPDIYIGCSGHRQQIPSKESRGSTKIAIHVNPHGPIKVKPNINEGEEGIGWVKKQHPDAVFGYGFQSDQKYWSYWKEKVGINWIPMPTAADAIIFKPQLDKKFDFAYVGGFWKYKGINLNKYIVPLMRQRLNYKVCGWGDWPSEFNVQECSDGKKVKILQSAMIGPCVSESHTTTYGIDLPERVFKVILCGAIAIHDPVKNGSTNLSSVLWTTDPKDYVNSVYKILDLSYNKRVDLWHRQYNEIFGHHTYHHRLAKLFSGLGFNDEAGIMLQSLEKHRYGF